MTTGTDLFGLFDSGSIAMLITAELREQPAAPRPLLVSLGADRVIRGHQLELASLCSGIESAGPWASSRDATRSRGFQ
jgi:hypothetical protein